MGNIYEAVDRIPEGYQIWHISGASDFVPLCKKVWEHDGIEDTDNVDTGSLKAVRLSEEDVETVMSASEYADTLKAMKRYVSSHKEGSYTKPVWKKIALFKRAIPVLEKIMAKGGDEL